MANAQPLELSDRHYSAVMAARRWTAYTPSGDEITDAPRGVMTDDGGTVTMEDDNAVSIVVDMTAWEIRPLSPTKITASTATTVYLIY